MKLVQILKGSTVRVAKPDKPFGYLPDVTQVVTEHFGFQEYPIDFSKLLAHGTADPESPANFRHGRVEIDGKQLLIDELQIYQNGSIVSTPGNTLDSDLITDYLYRWSSERFQLNFQIIGAGSHFSQLEIEFDRSLADLFSALKEIGSDINKGLDSSWENIPTYQLVNVQFGLDPTKTPQVNPGTFRIEARANMQLETKLYFCEAAMTTANHMSILSKFERICLEKFVGS
jgi:hypothetical protein